MSLEDLSTLSLFPATKEQILESRKRTYPQWGRGLTLEGYFARESRLDIAEHAQGDKFTTWVLAPRENPTTLDFKSSCETYRRRSLVKRPGSTSSEEVYGYGIASVFTPPNNRGKGYARRLMSFLHWVIAPHASLPPFPSSWGTPPPERPGCNNGVFSALYSDIGPDFYASAGPSEDTKGWIVREPYSTIWDVPKDLEPISSVRWLNEDSCKEVIERDTELIRKSFPSDPERVTFGFLPNEGVAMFMIFRTEFFAPGQPYAIPDKWGVELPPKDSSEESLCFATWSLDVRPPPPTLIVTRIRATKETFPTILSCLFSAARESDMKRVEIWNLPSDLEEVAEQSGGRKEERDEHLNAFKWYGPEKNEDLKWVYNEK
ncbi:uncharacterized protein FOMMEDRAFT_71777 [Fomitiporia mediterranea MF3/22]|uniref:uncharacterized protein n=1 Tax=Fomitiporia mediterranea (strain MF3/22) TaxID=694068 RepID=UPI000440820C|nr:uncharacterized protein FOMMEDRAFT_71777 [Fomitiporia mediterranea MF3/22]EJD07437.1 hypothetical protein FOMMEDRAFT_71777 [Fomitiporia mediterranea MF3/22]